MRRHLFVIILILMMGLVIPACNGLDSEPADPTDVLSTVAPSPEPLPTETIILPTQTSTLEPTPTTPPTFTPTPIPFLPDNLILLTYRTLGQVAELASIPLTNVSDLEFSPDGRYLRIRVPVNEETHQDLFYDLMTGSEIFRLEEGQRVYFNQVGSSIISLDGNEITSYDLLTGDGETIYTGDYLVSALSPDGQLVVELEYEERGGPGTTFHVIDLSTGEERYQLYVNGKIEKEGFNFDADGKNMAVAYFVPPGTYVASVWVAKSGRVLYTEYGFTEIDLHPFGSEAALSSSRRSFISLISTVTWEQRVYLGSAEDEPGFYAIKYADKGRLMYALSDRETSQAFFWYPPSGEPIDLDLGLDMLALTISPDRRLLATSDKSGSVNIWGVLD